MTDLNPTRSLIVNQAVAQDSSVIGVNLFTLDTLNDAPATGFGLLVGGDCDVKLLEPILPRLNLIAVQFPKVVDGRGYRDMPVFPGGKPGDQVTMPLADQGTCEHGPTATYIRRPQPEPDGRWFYDFAPTPAQIARVLAYSAHAGQRDKPGELGLDATLEVS